MKTLSFGAKDQAVPEPLLGIGTVAALLTWTTAYARRRTPAAAAAGA